MFGDCYTYQKQPKILEEGDYQVTLGRPFLTTVGNYNVLRFPFKVDGEKEFVVPCYFDLFDITDRKDPKQIDMFCKKASRIKDCFNLEGDFSEINYMKWEGKHGKIHISKSEGGFMNVTKFYPAPKENQGDLFNKENEVPIY